ncbi:hypothetical protein BDN70DRAFT_877590 [Pholiota conissans]|uniref:Uncharacterized protein n=1 Tax=Pholiota conissans TaxID=109636 RepID=A0A9P5Z571_9AGAR|nr:hypothetical protein BDN70DRAFT_877590 [Pholiota conissans]
MLKRQRQPSPLPSSPSIPFVADAPSDMIERDSKRRRTVPPVLEGAARGWAAGQSVPNDDDEYTYSDDEVQPDIPNPNQCQSTSEYKSTNTMLRELHTMHQHRLLFASPSDGQNSNILHTPNPMYTMSINSYQPSMSDKTHLPLPNECMRPVHTSQLVGKIVQSDGMLTEEAARVAELYEGPNKYLGSLFLSRRHTLDSSDEVSGR